jgi:hypothetical protein
VVFVVQYLETFEIVIPVVLALRELDVPVRIVVAAERDIMRHYSTDGERYDTERVGIVWNWLARNGFDPEPLLPPEQGGAQVHELEPFAVFMPSPYEAQRHPSLDPTVLGLPIHYVDYGFHVDPEDASGWQFYDEFFKDARSIYVANDYEAECFRNGGVPDGTVVRSGSPALDHWDTYSGRSAVPTVMWCPWWSTDGKMTGRAGYSTFLVTWRTMLAEFEARPHMRFIFRPHPLLLEDMRAKQSWSESDQQEFGERMADLPTVTVADSFLASSHIPQFEQAWAMVTDGVSYLGEFSYTGKPLLLTEAPDNMGWNPVGRAIRSVVETSDYAVRVPDFLDRVAADDDPDRRRRLMTVRAQYIRPPGGSGRAIARHLLSLAHESDRVR